MQYENLPINITLTSRKGNGVQHTEKVNSYTKNTTK